MKIAIIGTAGRKEDGPKMTRELYFKMVQKARSIVESLSDDIHLVSGGAAWSDHTVISLFLLDLASSLTLYLPCLFDVNTNKFIGTVGNTAKTANYYHELFSKKMGRNTREGITSAINAGAVVYPVMGGFFQRNLKVGQVDALIAFTWGEGDIPKDGGTSHTWNHSHAKIKIHIPLSTL